MNNDQLTIQIEAYLDNEMTEQDRLDFENRMKNDEDLRKKVLLQENIRLAFKRMPEMQLRKRMDELFEENQHRFEEPLDMSDVDNDFIKEIEVEADRIYGTGDLHNIKETGKNIPKTQAIVVSIEKNDNPNTPKRNKNNFGFWAMAASFAVLVCAGFWLFTRPNTEGGIIPPPIVNNDSNKPITQPDSPSIDIKTPNLPKTNEPTVVNDNKTNVPVIIDKKDNNIPVIEPLNGDEGLNKELANLSQKEAIKRFYEDEIGDTRGGDNTSKDLFLKAVETSKKDNNDVSGYKIYIENTAKRNDLSIDDKQNLAYSYFRLKQYEQSIAKYEEVLPQLTGDEKDKINYLLLLSYLGNYTKYKKEIGALFNQMITDSKYKNSATKLKAEFDKKIKK